MKQQTRTSNFVLNIVFGYIAQIIVLILSFIGRKVFLSYLDADLLGVNGLFSNILTVLSLAELGLDTAFTFTLYKPLAEKQYGFVKKLLKLFKRIYLIVTLVVLTVGLCLIPALPFILKTDLPRENTTIYYIFFLSNTVLSYVVADRLILIIASQEQRLQKIVTVSVSIIAQILHIIVLSIWKNYYLYLVVNLISVLLTDFLIYFITRRRYKFIFDAEEDDTRINKKPIFKKIISSFLYKLGGILINNTDNILTSVIVSTAAVGFYSNYYTIIAAVQGFIAIISSSLIVGVGNYSVEKTPEEQRKLFNISLLFYQFVSLVFFVGFSCVFNDFITIWLGEKYVLNNSIVIIISLNFFFTNSVTPVWAFREANGLFDQVKFLLLVRAGLNLGLSILFGVLWGMFGIFLATLVSFLLTSFWFEPKLLFEKVFHAHAKEYWKKQLVYYLVTIVAFGICFSVSYFYRTDFLKGFLIKGFISVIVSILCFLIAFGRSIEFKSIIRGINAKRLSMKAEFHKRFPRITDEVIQKFYTYIDVVFILFCSGYLLTFTNSNTFLKSTAFLLLFLYSFISLLAKTGGLKQTLMVFKREMISVIFVSLVFIGALLSLLFNKEFAHLASYLIIIFIVISAFCLSQKHKLGDFVRCFVNVLTFLSLTSVFFYLFYVCSGKTTISIFPIYTSSISGSSYQNFFFISFLLKNSSRIQGPFWEPGLFGSILVLSLFLHISFEKKISAFKFCALSIGVILTFSTFSYLVYFIVLVALIKKLVKNKLIMNFVYLTSFGLLCLTVIFYKPIFEMLAKILPSVFSKMSNPEESYSFLTRLYSPYINFTIFLKKPLFGFGMFSGDVEYSKAISQTFVDSQTSTTGQLAVWFGILGLLITPFVIFVFLRNKILDIPGRIMFLLLFLLMINEEPHSYIVLSWYIVFALGNSKNQSKINIAISSNYHLVKI